MSDWREQYSRMLRFRGKLDAVPQGDSCDTFYAFAQSCWHFADWLGSDSGQSIRRERAYQHVQASPVLSVCRDLANGSKHAALEAKKIETERRSETVYIRINGELVQDRVFADQCIEAWNILLGDGGLKPDDALRFPG
jgi:hypothetical protein